MSNDLFNYFRFVYISLPAAILSQTFREWFSHRCFSSGSLMRLCANGTSLNEIPTRPSAAADEWRLDVRQSKWCLSLDRTRSNGTLRETSDHPRRERLVMWCCSLWATGKNSLWCIRKMILLSSNRSVICQMPNLLACPLRCCLAIVDRGTWWVEGSSLHLHCHRLM